MKLETTPEVSKHMKALSHGKSKVEAVLAKALWHKGYHYRLNYKELPGKPDIVLTKYRIAIFVDGEFWHGKDFDINKYRIKSHREYWINKIEKNMERDVRNDNLLRQMDWIPLHFWSKDVEKYTEYCIDEIEEWINSRKDTNIE